MYTMSPSSTRSVLTSLFALLSSIPSFIDAQSLRPTEDCPILGPAFPSSFDIGSTRAFQEAAASFPQRIEALFEDGIINRTHSSISVDVYSTVTNQSIYSYFHAAPGINHTLSQGVLNDETIQRIGSVSKLVTVYALLVKAGIDILSDPVTKYIPELAGNPKDDPLGLIHFEGVTIEALMSHMGGTGGFSKIERYCYH
jgi:CubicO group peptidase (beta-lactamase class C family)